MQSVFLTCPMALCCPALRLPGGVLSFSILKILAVTTGVGYHTKLK